MKIVLYLTAAFWASAGLAIYFDVAFDFSIINSGFLLIGFLGLAILCFLGIDYLRKKLAIPIWFGFPVAIVSSASVLALGLFAALVILLGNGIFSATSNYTVGGLNCRAEVMGGAMTSIDRLDVALFRPLIFGLERKVAHHSRILKGSDHVTLKEECSKLAITVAN